MPTLASPPLLDRLAPCRRVLLAGAGGGFDVLSAVPLFEALRGRGQEVFLASLSFSSLKEASGRRLKRSGAVVVGPTAGGPADYFPEKHLSCWFAERGQDVPVYCYPRSGARNVLGVYEDLVRELDLDALVLVDGGTDILMRGDEPSLGSPAEDLASLAAASMLDLPVRLVVCLGFGVDAVHHGVCHAYVLEAVADLAAGGGFLGAFSLLPGMPEFEAFAAASEFVNARSAQPSVLTSSVVAAARGHFGDHHPTARTAGSELFLNPLMAMYWAFEADALASRCLYLDYMKDTYTTWDVHRALSNYLYTVTPREWRNLPI